MLTEFTTDECVALDAVPTQLYIAGRWHDSLRDHRIPVYDPATGAVLREVADAGPDDALAALDAAAGAQAAWAAYPPRERGEILRRAYERLIARKGELALLMTLEMGKPLSESEAEVSYAAEFFRWFSEEAVRIEGSYSPSPDKQSRMLTTRQPVGPCLLITPWNFPMAMGTRKIGPAIAAGCTMVVKPARQTPLSMLALAAILHDCGLPSGVLNVVTTSTSGELADLLLADRRLRKLSFTGSTEVGRRLMAAAAGGLLRVSMELGGNAPFLVFEDADIDAAVDGAMMAKMRNIGEACTAANRFYVARPVAEEFVGRLTERMQALTVGRGTEDKVDVGPLIDDAACEKVDSLVKDADERGARVRTGGHRLDRPGCFYAPTVLSDVPEGARVLGEEVFGPVAPVVTFSSDDDAIEMANATDYGLVGYAYTSDTARSFRLIDELQVGMVGLNRGVVSNPAAPFGGIKQSGFGREGGREGIGEYLETKYVLWGA